MTKTYADICYISGVDFTDLLCDESHRDVLAAIRKKEVKCRVTCCSAVQRVAARCKVGAASVEASTEGCARAFVRRARLGQGQAQRQLRAARERARPERDMPLLGHPARASYGRWAQPASGCE